MSETLAPMTDRVRQILMERALYQALARIERWQHDTQSGFKPPADEIRSAIIDIRNTLQEIQS